MKWIGERISTKDHNDGSTTIIIYPMKHNLKEFLLTFWVVSFTFVGCYMIYLLASGLDQVAIDEMVTEETKEQQKIYLIIFIGFWTYFEYITLRGLLWYKFGKEFIKIDDVAITVKRSIFKYGKAHRFLFENIKNFSVVEPEKTSFSYFFDNAYWTVGTDALTFKYFHKNRSFGRRLDEKDAKLLIRFIDSRVKKKLKKL